MNLWALICESWSTSVLAIGCCIALTLWWWRQGPKNAPPGPIGYPYIGSLLTIIRSSVKGTMLNYMIDLHDKYGPIVAVKVGIQRFIYINDGPLVAQLLGREEFALRPVDNFPTLKRIAHGTPRGLILGNGEPHKEMRRFALLSLRDFGVGKKSIDEMIQTEATILCQHLEELADSNGVMSDLKIKMQHATANVIHHIVFGYRQEYDDPKWKVLVKTLYDFFDISFLSLPGNYLPIVEMIPPLNRYLVGDKSDKFFKLNETLEGYMNSQIEQHKSTYMEGEIRDFIDLYIKYESEEKEFYTKENIFATMLDLFRAGSDTAATTLTWAVMYLVKEPDIQRQLREEIDEVVGDRQFDRKDKDQLVKTRAFINEIHRYISIAITTPPHTVAKPVDVSGYTLLPNDAIFPSIHAIHHDKQYWVDPYTFCIERWIDEKGKLIKHDGHFYPFSVGKRTCPGKQFATIEVMLILVQFLQNFTFEGAESYGDITEEQGSGPLRTPKSFHLKVLRR